MGQMHCFGQLTAAEIREAIEKLQLTLGHYTQQEMQLRRELKRALRKEGRDDSKNGWHRPPCDQMRTITHCPCPPEQKARRLTSGFSNRKNFEVVV